MQRVLVCLRKAFAERIDEQVPEQLVVVLQQQVQIVLGWLVLVYYSRNVLLEPQRPEPS